MNQLITIQSAAIGTDAIPTCSARDLHEFLQVQTQFKDWIARRIEEYEFEESRDFCCSNLSGKKEGSGGHNRKDYHLSLDMAKELSMVERTEKGKQARQYFIECERLAKTGGQAKIAKPSQQITEAAKVFKANFSIMRLIGCDKNAAAISANQATQKTIGINFDKTHLTAANQDSAHYIPTKIGEHLGGLSAQAVNKRLTEAGLQERIAGEWEATPAGKPHSRRVDTAMRHSDGRPVSQLLWALSVLPFIQDMQEAA